MKLVALILVAATLLGAPGDTPRRGDVPPRGVVPPRDDASPPGEVVNVRMWAVHAYNTGQKPRQLDKGLDEIRSALDDVRFDTLRLLKTATLKAPYNKETKTAINAKYSLHVKPLSKQPGGRIKIEARVAMSQKEQKDGKPVNAVGVTALAVPGQKLKVRGLPLEQGELVVVLSVKE